MTNPWVERWNERYREPEYAYGKEPNHYLREKLGLLSPGSILFPAEGEGRNAVFAAKQGWAVFAFDISIEGQKKAIQLALENRVDIDYKVGYLEDLTYEPESFDAIALIYAHFPAGVKSSIHNRLITLLRPGGIVIFEAFSKQHLEYRAKNEKVGGPSELDMLFSTDEILSDFEDFEIQELTEMTIELKEGIYHNGTGSVIRFTGRKK